MTRSHLGMRIRFTSDDEHERDARDAREAGRSLPLHWGARLDLEGAAPHELSPSTLLAARAYAVARRNSGVVSGVSAGNLHGLPFRPHRLDEPVMLTRTHRGRVSDSVRVRRSRLDDDDVETIHGMQVTTLRRTLVDLAEYLEVDELLPLADAAMRSGLDPPGCRTTAGTAASCVGSPGAHPSARTATTSRGAGR